MMFNHTRILDIDVQYIFHLIRQIFEERSTSEPFLKYLSFGFYETR